MNAEHAPVVTLAALYGAGGTVVGRGVAKRLGVPFLARAIPDDVATEKGLSHGAVAAIDEEPRTRMARLFSILGRATTARDVTAGPASLDLQEHRLRGYIEERLARASVSGGVVLGRGGMVVLRAVPWALHVHMSGPRDARITQAMTIEHIDLATAERRQEAEDGARIEYVRRAYGVNGGDPSLYHLILDSTALDLETCVDLIVAGAQARARAPGASNPT